MVNETSPCKSLFENAPRGINHYNFPFFLQIFKYSFYHVSNPRALICSAYCLSSSSASSALKPSPVASRSILKPSRILSADQGGAGCQWRSRHSRHPTHFPYCSWFFPCPSSPPCQWCSSRFPLDPLPTLAPGNRKPSHTGCGHAGETSLLQTLRDSVPWWWGKCATL